VIFDVDVQGAFSLKKLYKDDAVLVFVLPPSIDELEKRLRKRSTDSPETIKMRINNAKEELLRLGEYDYFIVNDDLEEGIKKAQAIYNAECLKVSRLINKNISE
jgi:guanylate kinase